MCKPILEVDIHPIYSIYFFNYIDNEIKDI